MMYKDKVDHFMYWFFITKVCMCFMPMPFACLSAFLLGIAKEIYDKVSGKGTCDWKDLVADVCGILAGILTGILAGNLI